MKITLNRLINQEVLTKEEAKEALVKISKGDTSQSEIAAFLTVFMMRTIQIEELEGFRDALLELCIPVAIEAYNPIDLCGTGGDGKNTFNISTTAALVTAGAGIKVAKHGNYGVSSVSGSSNVMEYLGIHFSTNPSFLEKCIDTTNICILHAPLFHPAMKHVAPIRKELGVKTFFNMLGPMVNPALPKNQIVGVFSLELARMYGYLYQKTDKNYSILHDLAGYDEISLTGPAKVISNSSEILLDADFFRLKNVSQEAIFGGNTIKDAATILLSILNGNGTEAQNNVVCANAAVAIATAKQIEIKEGFEEAKESLFSGKAAKALRQLQELSKNK